MGDIGGAFGGMGEAVGGGVSSAGNAIGQLLGGSAGAVREAGPAGILLIVAFFVILAWVLRR